MLEELTILQSIIGDLSSVGLHIVLAYIAFRLAIIGAWCWFGYYIIGKVYSFFKADVSRLEYNDKIKEKDFEIKRFTDACHIYERNLEIAEEDHQRELKSRHQDLQIKLKEKESEIERIKHLYKILKESKGGE